MHDSMHNCIVSITILTKCNVGAPEVPSIIDLSFSKYIFDIVRNISL